MKLGLLAAAAALALAAFAAPADATAPTVQTVTVWKQNAEPTAWAAGRVYYNAKGAAGLFDGWAAAPDGTGAACVTCGLFPATTQHGVDDVSPDGRYALVTVERSGHWPVADGGSSAYPGNGAYNDLWLEATDRSHAWKLVDLLKTGSSALIWPRFNSTGTKVVWSEQHQCCVSWFGYWTLHVADLVWANGTPALANVKSYGGDGSTWFEPYGFTPDGSRVLFASEAWTGGKLDQSNTQIVMMASTLTGPVTRLSPKDQWCEAWWCPFTNYNEFAFTMPGSGRIVFGRIAGGHNGALEYWTINPDGSDPAQLTHMSQPGDSGYPQDIGGGVAFDPGNPQRFLAAVELDYGGDYEARMVTLAGGG